MRPCRELTSARRLCGPRPRLGRPWNWASAPSLPARRLSPRPHRLGSHEPGSDPVSQPHVCLPPKRLGSGLQPRSWTRTSCCSQTVDTGAGPGGAGSAGPRVHVMEGHTPQQLLSPGHLPFVKLVPEPACAPRLRVTTGLVRSPGRRARASIPACRGARVPSHTQGLFPALSLASCPGLCFKFACFHSGRKLTLPCVLGAHIASIRDLPGGGVPGSIYPVTEETGWSRPRPGHAPSEVRPVHCGCLLARPPCHTPSESTCQAGPGCPAAGSAGATGAGAAAAPSGSPASWSSRHKGACHLWRPLCNMAFQTPGPLGPYPDLSPRSLSSPALSCPEAPSQSPSSPVATVPKAQEPVPSLQPRALAPWAPGVLSVTPARGPARPTQEAGEPT